MDPNEEIPDDVAEEIIKEHIAGSMAVLNDTIRKILETKRRQELGSGRYIDGIHDEGELTGKQ